MKIQHIKFPPKNGALLAYISNKRAILAHYIRKMIGNIKDNCFQ